MVNILDAYTLHPTEEDPIEDILGDTTKYVPTMITIRQKNFIINIPI